MILTIIVKVKSLNHGILICRNRAIFHYFGLLSQPLFASCISCSTGFLQAAGTRDKQR